MDIVDRSQPHSIQSQFLKSACTRTSLGLGDQDVLHWLLQAKMEQNNFNKVQLSSRLQATSLASFRIMATNTLQFA